MLPQTQERGGVPYVPDLSDNSAPSEARKRIALHSCCGPCSTAVIERLAPDFDITVFFYNPNITDCAEYERRLDAQRDFIERYNASPGVDRPVTLSVGAYEPEVFFSRTAGLETEPEGGARCAVCFELRLEKSAEFASMHGFEYFTTTLSVSPHKDHSVIHGIGTRLALRCGLTFHAEDFKKRDGYKRSLELSRAYGLYRQNYCGCEFSRREAGIR
ncbi:MAG: epoxyqueuosine reductase QueH [Clostridiales Family XIII bacterium]|jgi:predicted adenine nucleotide alpha hydrolase (AANH) superfamily ATPase|nr:epoxyqueuosine reductase QueH [Clostridiales Family XIII bacterium]